jgi:hypothetical protein
MQLRWLFAEMYGLLSGVQNNRTHFLLLDLFKKMFWFLHVINEIAVADVRDTTLNTECFSSIYTAQGPFRRRSESYLSRKLVFLANVNESNSLHGCVSILIRFYM